MSGSNRRGSLALRTALVELGQAEKPQTARLPLSVQRVLEDVQNQLRGIGEAAVG